jgi:hypothetical protein
VIDMLDSRQIGTAAGTIVVLLAGTVIAARPQESPTAAQAGGASKLFHGHQPFQFVGVRLWLVSSSGQAATDDAVSFADGPFVLHVESNTAGFLSVWSTSDGAQLTPTFKGYSGHRLDARMDYVVPGRFRRSRASSEGELLVLFARAQMEQVPSAAAARTKIGRLLASPSVRHSGPQVVSEIDRSPERIGRYVVNRDGAQPAAVLQLVRIP